jgi:hypothetical protein
MHRLIQTSLCCIALLCATAAHAEDPAPTYASRAQTTVEDTGAILNLTKDFRSAIVNKDAKALSSLLLNSDILFASPMPSEHIKMVNGKYDVNFNGLGSGGFMQFGHFIGTSPQPLEEKFYNIKITQDANVGWVMFDYEFLVAGKVENFGIETWQVMKDVDGKWKILSVVWSSHLKPR